MPADAIRVTPNEFTQQKLSYKRNDRSSSERTLVWIKPTSICSTVESNEAAEQGGPLCIFSCSKMASMSSEFDANGHPSRELVVLVTRHTCHGLVN
jgi:hypothetical protein